jgi:predicted permease
VLGAVSILLAIACANFSGLLLVRAAQRSRELAIRAALGGGRGRLVRQLTTESLLLAALGGVAGLLVAQWAIDFIRTLAEVGLPRAGEVRFDGRIAGFAVLATALTGLVAGILPALAASRVDVQHALKDGGALAGPRRHRLRSGLVVGQLALAILLLAAAGVVLRTLDRLQRVDLGFRAEQVLTARIAPTSNGRVLVENLVERVQRLPGVVAAGAISSAPMSAYNTSNHVFPVGPAALPAGTSIQSEWRIVTADYFRALQIPVLRGRAFTTTDDGRAGRVVLINRSLASQLWGDADPIGRQINPGGGTTYSTVVGVVGDIRSRDPARPANPAYYLSAHRGLWGPMTLTIRTTGDATALVPQLRAELRALDATLPLFDVQTLGALVDQRLATRRVLTTVLTTFAAVALTLAGAGLYGVMAHATGQRTREVGIRIALGAQRRQVVWPLLAQGVRLTACGTLIGAGLVATALPLVRGKFDAVTAADPLALGAAISLLAVVALVACYVPARRASRLDPLTALRHE